MNEEQTKKLEAIAETHGLMEQLPILAEECTELAKAALKYYRYLKTHNETDGYTVNLNHAITEESADVTIMIEQIKYLLNIRNDYFNDAIDYKLNRQMERDKLK